jgi:hypothetical protein
LLADLGARELRSSPVIYETVAANVIAAIYLLDEKSVGEIITGLRHSN